MFIFRFKVLRHFWNHMLSLLRNEMLSVSGFCNAYWKNNIFEEANYYFDLQMNYSTREINSNLPRAQGYYSYYERAGVYAFRGEKGKAYKDLWQFNQQATVLLAMVNLIKIDPLFESIRDESEFQQIVRDLEAIYQAEHERVRKWLEELGIL